MDQSSSLDKICRDELGLGFISSVQLQNGVKRYIEAWNLFAVPGQRFSELSDATVKAYAGRYLDQGWNRDERVEKGAERGMKVAPGKHLWLPINGFKRSKYKYPKDTELIWKGIETIFHLMKQNVQGENPTANYPTPTSVHKRKRSNVASEGSSSGSDTTDDDAPNFRIARNRAACGSRLPLNNEPRKPQEGDDDASFHPTPSGPDSFEFMIGTTDVGAEAHAEPLQGLANPFHAKPKSPKHKASEKNIGCLPNQRTLKESGFTAVTKPVTPENRQNGLHSRNASKGTGRTAGIGTVSPTIVSDDESLPRSPREYFGLIQTPREIERSSTVPNAESLLQTTKGPDDTETPTRGPKTTGPSVVRSSNTIKARNILDRRPPLGVLHTEENRLKSTLSTRSTKTQPSEPPPKEEPSQSFAVAPSVDDSVGSRTAREMSQVSSIDLAAPTSQITPRLEEPELGTSSEEGEPTLPDRSSGSELPEIDDESVSRSPSHPSINFWVLKTSKPYNKWTNWADATLDHETIDSILNAIGRFTGNRACNTVDVQLQTPGEEYSFQILRDHMDRFEAMKAFMLGQIIDAGRCTAASYPVISIYLRPGLDSSSEV